MAQITANWCNQVQITAKASPLRGAGKQQHACEAFNLSPICTRMPAHAIQRLRAGAIGGGAVGVPCGAVAAPPGGTAASPGGGGVIPGGAVIGGGGVTAPGGGRTMVSPARVPAAGGIPV